MVFIPNTKTVVKINCKHLSSCNDSYEIKTASCQWSNGNSSEFIAVDLATYCTTSFDSISCLSANETVLLVCDEPDTEFYIGFTFWAFTILMSLGTIGYNVSNCISDAICFYILGNGCEMKYGQQRVWGTIGFGISALLGGFAMDFLNDDVTQSQGTKDYFPAFSIATLCMIIDILCCIKLKLPPMPKSENISRDISKLIKQPHIVTFLFFAVFVGICDASIIFYLLWYLEDLAAATGFTSNIKLLQGITVAVETLCGEVIMFALSGKILSRIGFGHCLSMCFAFYALRMSLIAAIPSPWWIIPIEMFMQGPTYALCYTTVVAYASAVAPPGTSGTIQGIVAGVDDGLGFSIGSIVGGIIYKIYGGRMLFIITSVVALTCCLAHSVLFNLYFKHSLDKPSNSTPLKTSHTTHIEASECETAKFVPDRNNEVTIIH
ncbi:major facilitator superfamily domain-containing protein 6 isoform X2 [Rhodnius prolixus]